MKLGNTLAVKVCLKDLSYSHKGNRHAGGCLLSFLLFLRL